ncbi:hypothetical protein FB451DRAFT_1237594 [Mycena latifolia]|nr:hypothetical protein FB451DRAFT_1237594 [Mycena latifolia]
MDSVSSTDSSGSGPPSPGSPTRAPFLPFTHKVTVPQQQRDDLVAALDKWRTQKQARRANGRSLMSKRVDLSDTQLQKLADHGADFLRAAAVTPDLICKFVPWDLASRDDLKAVASIIMDWRLDAQLAIGLTPRGGQQQKKQNTHSTPPATTNGPRRVTRPIAQPSFSPARITRGRGRGRGRGVGRGAGQARINDDNFFAPTVSTSIPPRTISTRSSSIPQPSPSQPSIFTQQPAAFSESVPPTQLTIPYMPYYSPYMYPPTGAQYPAMYQTYGLPPRYYPTAPDSQNTNI